jgi:hypothetical protein
VSEPVRSGRETRLLALVIVIAIAALMLLARFRFPGVTDGPAVAPPPNPIDRIATRPFYYEQLGSAISALAERLAPSFVVVDIAIVPPATSGNGRKSRPSGATSSPVVVAQIPPTRLAALRIPSDRALVYLPANARVLSIAGVEESKPDMVVDTAREVGLLRVPITPETSSLLFARAEPLAPFGYALVIEGARGGPTTRPVFIGRLDQIEDAAWSAPIAVIGGATDVTPGAMLFHLDGRFAGMALRTPHGLAIVPPRALQTIASALLAPKNAAMPDGRLAEPGRSLGGGGSRF